MKQFEQVIEKDPLKLKQYEGGSQGAKSSRNLYGLAALAGIFLVSSLVLAILGSLSDLGDVSELNKHIVSTEISDDSSSTSVSEEEALLGLNTTQKVIPIVGEVFSDRNKVADSFSKIQLGLRIMPSQNDEAGLLIMKWTNEDNDEEAKLGSKVDKDDNYFLVTNTADYFPILRIDSDHVPMGSASSLCVHLDWTKVDKKKMVDQYRSVLGFPNCTNALNPKFRWQANDPKTGVDFKVWKQQVQKVESESECNHLDGIFQANNKKEGGRCYSYMILKRLCLLVAFKEHPQTSSYFWEYRGGCYGSGEIGVYEKGTPGSEYRFDQVPIEVREDESLYVVAGNLSSNARNTLSPLFKFLSTVCLVFALLSAIGFAFLYLKQTGRLGSNSARHVQQIDEKNS